MPQAVPNLTKRIAALNVRFLQHEKAPRGVGDRLGEPLQRLFSVERESHKNVRHSGSDPFVRTTTVKITIAARSPDAPTLTV
jgi:hypothetical protein